MSDKSQVHDNNHDDAGCTRMCRNAEVTTMTLHHLITTITVYHDVRYSRCYKHTGNPKARELRAFVGVASIVRDIAACLFRHHLQDVHQRANLPLRRRLFGGLHLTM